MTDPPIRLRDRIVLRVLLPVLAAGLLLSWAGNRYLTPPLVDYLHREADRMLRHAAEHGIAICDNHLNYLLDLRLEDDAEMAAALKREALAEIEAIHANLPRIHMLVFRKDGTLAGGTLEGGAALRLDALSPGGGAVHTAHVEGLAVRLHARYFPFWRWTIVSVISERDYTAPVVMARNVVFAATLGVVAVLLLTVLLVFRRLVAGPLRALSDATRDVTAGRFVPVAAARHDEIGRLAGTFNRMVAALERTAGQNRDLIAALSESEEKYRRLVENANDAIFVTQDECIRFVNRQAERFVGMDRRALVDRRFLDLVHPDDHPAVRGRHHEHMAGREPPRSQAFRVLRADGEVRWGHLTAVGIEWEKRPATLHFMRDITAEKTLEDQFHQAQRLEGVATLAGGIAHDFNNLLMGIQGNAALALADVGPRHPAARRLRHVETLVQDGVGLTRQLLGFARGGKYEVRPTDMNRLIKRHNQMFGRAKKEIRIRGTYAPEAWTVMVDRGQMEQVLLNLYVNAWQAMPGGGDLRVRTANETVGDKTARSHAVEPGRYLRIDVADTGVGMDEAVQQRIFDPFFTTKEREWGTGLGLASVYGIVKNHGGFVLVASRPGEGATFSLFLPATDLAVEEEQPPPKGVHPGRGSVLLVDDEEMVLNVSRGMLERLGYRVRAAASGREALDLIASADAPVDVVLLDLIMPDMGGGEVFDRIREISPSTRVILSSGYSIDGEAAEILDRGCDGFIQKPFGLQELSAKIREVLDMGEG